MAFSGLKMTRNSNGFVFKTEDEQLNQRIELRFSTLHQTKKVLIRLLLLR